MNGYSRDERGKCKKCSDAGLKIAFPVLASVGILCCLFFLVWSTVIKRGGAFGASDGAKKIFISYLQLATLATTMDIPWPGNYLAVFRAQALVSSVGEAFIDVRCAMDEPVSIAQAEYGKTLAYALLPFALVLSPGSANHEMNESMPACATMPTQDRSCAGSARGRLGA